MSRYGKRGGDGPNTGKKAIHFMATTSDGTVVKRRFFVPGFDFPDLTNGVAAILKPMNGHPWSLWRVAPTEAEMPDYVKRDANYVEFQPVVRVEPTIKATKKGTRS